MPGFGHCEHVYHDEIAAQQAELECTRADIGLHMDAHSAHLHEVITYAISNDLQASAPANEEDHLYP